VELSNGMRDNGQESVENSSAAHTRTVSQQGFDPIEVLLHGKNNQGKIIVRMNRD